MSEYVYLIWASETDWYKIGVTTCPQSRLDALQTAAPTPLVFVSLMEVDAAVVIEKFLLEKWQSRSDDARGEWVKFHPWDLPEVFSDFRVDLANPVVIPKKQRPTPRYTPMSTNVHPVLPEDLHNIFPNAPYEVDPQNQDTLDAVRGALSLGKSRNWMLQNLFKGVSPGQNEKYKTFKQIVEKCQ